LCGQLLKCLSILKNFSYSYFLLGKKNENETSRKSTALPTTVKEPSTVESSVDAEIPNFSTGLQYNTASSQNSLVIIQPKRNNFAP